MPPLKDNVEMVGALRLPLCRSAASMATSTCAASKGAKIPSSRAARPARPDAPHSTTLLEKLLSLSQSSHNVPKNWLIPSDTSTSPPRRCLYAVGSAALRSDGWLPGGRLPLRPELEPRVSELPCVRVGMPMTVQQLSVAHNGGHALRPRVHAKPCTPNVTDSMLAASRGA